MATKRAKILRSQVMFQGKVFDVRTDRVREPDGVLATRDVVVHRGSIVVLPVFPDGSILLVRQYRHAVRGFLWELVAGHIERGESPIAGARRELTEETGYGAAGMRKLVSFFPSPGCMSERMTVFLATGLRSGTAHQEEDERIVSRRFSRAAVARMIERGALQDAKSLAGILFYWRFAQ